MTERQRLSIVTNEDNNLIVAGAGSGKTSVVVAKVIYLIQKKLVKPEELLVLAYNTKAKDELEEIIVDLKRVIERVENEGI